MKHASRSTRNASKISNDEFHRIVNGSYRQIHFQCRSLVSKTGNGSSGQIESSQLVEEMRRLHRELELNMTRQDQLQLRLEENIRESRAPRTFTFSGHGSSQVDLRVTDEFSKTSTTNVMHSGTMHERRSRSAGLSSTELDATDYRQQSTGRTSVLRDHFFFFPTPQQRVSMIGRLQRYVVGDVNDHDKLRRKIQDIKFDYKEIASGIASDVRSRQVCDLTDWSDARLAMAKKRSRTCLFLLP